MTDKSVYDVNGPFDRERLKQIIHNRKVYTGQPSRIMYVCPELEQEALREAQGLLEVVVEPDWKAGWYIA